MNIADLEAYLDTVIDIAHDAGELILAVYRDGFDVEMKGDGTPLTIADQRSHNLICSRLLELTPDIPILSEESDHIAYEDRCRWRSYWLVDPLDGTKEFVKKSGEFTVNIALMHENQPVLGVVHTPVKEWTHWGVHARGAWKQIGHGEKQRIQAKPYTGGNVTVVASKSHGQDKLEQFLNNVERQEGSYDVTNMGSALKICLVAEGIGDIYPRLGLTSEWDTASADVIIREAGGHIIQVDGKPVIYNKPNLLNPFFLAIGSGDYDWIPLLDGIDTNP
ncbi:MAG: 3'(2'),5'-bisphosphate nucleotidase CysQ [Arenicella sp.]